MQDSHRSGFWYLELKLCYNGYSVASTTSNTTIAFEASLSLLSWHSYLSGCSSGLPNDGGVGFTQQRLGKVRLLLQHLARLVYPTTAERRVTEGSGFNYGRQ